ncbi:hypothetical protein XO10_06115 [Marinitoga sp. 1135]|uniref:glycosyltransferase family A protein n=1 Tax=Marinitoga sp. 1135 TaxID=1643333 RepID=UPI001585E82E|nr:glycosyltransferase family A protein [Marinitoga sp. 1135]NUU95852.1 hypothetical protein [Marinitoga sp. 1135]
MKISTIITYYNGDINFFIQLLESINLASQKVRNFIHDFYHEIIIINDSNNIHTKEKINTIFKKRNFHVDEIKIITNEENFGIIRSRMIGIENTNDTDLFHIIDQDDFIDENFYVNSITLLEKYPKVDVIVSNKTLFITEKNNYIKSELIKGIDNKLLNRYNSKILKKYLYGGNMITSIGNYIFKGYLKEKIVYFYKSVPQIISGSDEYILSLYLLGNNCNFLFSNDLLLYYRLHNSNTSKILGNKFYDKDLNGIHFLYKSNIITFSQYKISSNIINLIAILHDEKTSLFKKILYSIKNIYLFIIRLYYSKILWRKKFLKRSQNHEINNPIRRKRNKTISNNQSC